MTPEQEAILRDLIREYAEATRAQAVQAATKGEVEAEILAYERRVLAARNLDRFIAQL